MQTCWGKQHPHIYSYFIWHPAECSQQCCFHCLVVLGEEQSARAQPTHCLHSAKSVPWGILGQQPLSSPEKQGCSSAIPYVPLPSTSACLQDTDAIVQSLINISDLFSSDRIDFWSTVSLFSLRAKTATWGCPTMKLITRRCPVSFDISPSPGIITFLYFKQPAGITCC